jgi:hypothetical protein
MPDPVLALLMPVTSLQKIRIADKSWLKPAPAFLQKVSVLHLIAIASNCVFYNHPRCPTVSESGKTSTSLPTNIGKADGHFIRRQRALDARAAPVEATRFNSGLAASLMAGGRLDILPPVFLRGQKIHGLEGAFLPILPQ